MKKIVIAERLGMVVGGIFYADTNRSDEINNYDNSCFMDIGHLNGKGARIYSEYLSNIILSECIG